MARPFLIALLISPALISACGGGSPSEQPAATSPAPESNPATPPTAEVTTSPPAVAPPPNTVGPALTPPPGTAAVKNDATKKAPEKPAFTRTDLRVGKGSEATKGKGVSVHYTGWLYDPSRPDLKGRMFDTSQERGPHRFVLGAGQVIPGWDEGFRGMKVGGRRRLIIPPELAYGVDGAGGIIPPNATLVFEMELLEVQQ